MNPTILRLDGVSKTFGGLKAVNQVGFEVARGKITALIGPNGAGKTTLINLITGVLPQSSGTIEMDGRDISRLGPAQRVRCGMSRSYQTPQMIKGLSALDNVVVGADLYSGFSMVDLFTRPWRVRRDNQAAVAAAEAALTQTGLNPAFWHQPAQSLSYGDQRRVEVARSLAQKPALLLLDEPAAGLNPAETQELGRDLKRFAQQGLTVLLVEHDMPLIMSIADHIVVVNFGEKLAQGTPQEIQRNESVVAAYLGTDLMDMPAPVAHPLARAPATPAHAIPTHALLETTP